MVEGKTKSGFKFKVDERAATDWRLIKAQQILNSSDVNAQSESLNEIVNLVIGASDMKRFEEHIAKKNDGFIPAEAVFAEISEILSSINATKNS